jgi:hypothetical protein
MDFVASMHLTPFISEEIILVIMDWRRLVERIEVFVDRLSCIL